MSLMYAKALRVHVVRYLVAAMVYWLCCWSTGSDARVQGWSAAFLLHPTPATKPGVGFFCCADWLSFTVTDIHQHFGDCAAVNEKSQIEIGLLTHCSYPSTADY